MSRGPDVKLVRPLPASPSLLAPLLASLLAYSAAASSAFCAAAASSAFCAAAASASASTRNVTSTGKLHGPTRLQVDPTAQQQ